MAIGIGIIAIGIWCIFDSYSDLSISGIASGAANIFIGVAGMLFSLRHLPDFAKKYIRLSENSIKFKKSWFIPRRKFIWDDIDKIEITRDSIRITTDYSDKAKVFELSSVSYEDYNLLHKAIVDTCLEHNIDMI